MKHSRSGYSRGCRCEVCTEAQRDYMRERKRQLTGYYEPKTETPCERCGEPFVTRPNKRFCSRMCQRSSTPRAVPLKQRALTAAKDAARGVSGDVVWVCTADGTPPTPVAKGAHYSMPKPLTVALRSGNTGRVIDILMQSTTPSGDGCMIWTGRTDTGGYPIVTAGGRRHSGHRVMAEAVHGPLHGQPVHHTCATRTCLAPAHLQPVSQRENIAEMLERNWYRQRITALEDALRAVQPSHPLVAPNSYLSCA